MKYLILTAGILFTLNVTAQTKKRVLKLSGNISEKYPVKMILTIQDNEVVGYYFYEKYKTKILLTGNIQESKIILNESPDYESEFKIGFVGELNEDKFIGNWIDVTNKKELAFSSSVYSDQKIEISDEIKQLEGNYKSTFNSDNFMGSINLKHISDNLFCFEVSTATESGCVGDLKGLIELINLKNGIYSDSLCEKLEISVESDLLTIDEENCDYHGMRCAFYGKYKKE